MDDDVSLRCHDRIHPPSVGGREKEIVETGENWRRRGRCRTRECGRAQEHRSTPREPTGEIEGTVKDADDPASFLLLAKMSIIYGLDGMDEAAVKLAQKYAEKMHRSLQPDPPSMYIMLAGLHCLEQYNFAVGLSYAQKGWLAAVGRVLLKVRSHVIRAQSLGTVGSERQSDLEAEGVWRIMEEDMDEGLDFTEGLIAALPALMADFWSFLGAGDRPAETESPEVKALLRLLRTYVELYIINNVDERDEAVTILQRSHLKQETAGLVVYCVKALRGGRRAAELEARKAWLTRYKSENASTWQQDVLALLGGQLTEDDTHFAWIQTLYHEKAFRPGAAQPPLHRHRRCQAYLLLKILNHHKEIKCEWVVPLTLKGLLCLPGHTRERARFLLDKLQRGVNEIKADDVREDLREWLKQEWRSIGKGPMALPTPDASRYLRLSAGAVIDLAIGPLDFLRYPGAPIYLYYALALPPPRRQAEPHPQRPASQLQQRRSSPSIGSGGSSRRSQQGEEGPVHAEEGPVAFPQKNGGSGRPPRSLRANRLASEQGDILFEERSSGGAAAGALAGDREVLSGLSTAERLAVPARIHQDKAQRSLKRIASHDISSESALNQRSSAADAAPINNPKKRTTGLTRWLARVQDAAAPQQQQKPMHLLDSHRPPRSAVSSPGRPLPPRTTPRGRPGAHAIAAYILYPSVRAPPCLSRHNVLINHRWRTPDV
ncbi:unnamed protein product [Vitrella brassicaformis CCMP3155]|uniref:Uncharacterized protein n=1 Tax=Vitrella brassicaformis (strain CCMP3155) TaxID=1169540 RepID=A0A0G4GN97_VITBC|nr:unnamed protein product [Vitrella brassicaformis CCMP3155]|eukprot:CEM31674.1 unnamed protein product [Vitrella brassicaformis CCMP3155]